MRIKPKKPPKERIIETALRLFYEQGYIATGINQIIAESSVAKATFYTHFHSKEALCIAYLQARHKVWMGWLADSLSGNMSAEEKITGIFDFLRDWMSGSNFRGCAFLNIATEIPARDSKIREEVIKHKNDLQNYLETIIDGLAVSGACIKKTDTRSAARMIYVLVEGAIVASQNYGEVWPIDDARSAAQELLGF